VRNNRVVLCVLAVVALGVSLPSLASTITVTSLGDSGAGTLRAAIETANTAPPGADTITFQPGLAGKTIHLLSDLPQLTDDNTTIDGDLNDDGKPDIVLSGDRASVSNGLNISSASNLIQGLCINHCGNGIYIHDTTARNNTVVSCYLGTNLKGTAPAPNDSYGLYLNYAGPNNTIGGTTGDARNVISGNYNYGIYVYHTSRTSIVGLFCGLNAAGTSVLGNISGGIYAQYASNTTIGAAVSTASTVVSGNYNTGVSLNYSSSVRVRNARIGTNAAGTMPRPNNGYGLYLYACNGAVIGGANALEGNLISGNASYGVDAAYCASGPVMRGNQIGTNLAGTDVVPNSYSGVYLSFCSGVTIGGSTVAARNIISGNGDDAITLYHCFTTNVKGNYLGVGKNGKTDLRNAGDGVQGDSCVTLNIGGSTAAERNVIVGDGAGVRLSGSQGSSNNVLNNYIGYGADGNTALPCGTGAHVSNGIRKVLIGRAGKGNRILSSGDGVYVYRAGSGCQVVENRIGAPVGKTPWGNTGLEIGYCAPVIDGNQVLQQSSYGLYIYGPQATSVVKNNTFRKGGKGVYITSNARPNLGDRGNSSTADNGNNTLVGNSDFDIYNSSPYDIKAEGNTFASTKAETIDARFIYDKLDNPAYGRVDYAPLKSGAPTSLGTRALAMTVAAAPTRAGGAQIVVGLATAGALQAQVRNLAGRPVRALPVVEAQAGANTLLWDGRSGGGTAVPSGAYLIEVTCRTPDGQQQRQVTTVSLTR
jgi:hypothetical protein